MNAAAHLPLAVASALAILLPLAGAVVVGLQLLARAQWLGERAVTRVVRGALLGSLVAAGALLAQVLGGAGAARAGELDFGSWLSVGTYQIPLVLLVDELAVVFSVLAAVLTWLVGTFSRTYLHREPGFARFYVLLGLFAAGTQLVALAGALDLLFAGWELIGISSALFIGFFHEREMPARSSVRAFATYRLCDTGLLIAMVTLHELLGSTRLSALPQAAALSPAARGTVAALLLLAAMGKSAQLPFSGWLPRAMEGPTPSSALFYGAISIHAGVFLLLRVAPVLAAAPVVEAAGVLVGVLTAWYATLVARTHTDAKGALAHATLAQIGLILAEICLGLTTLALVHLVCHALLRSWQFLRAPNTIHDAHAFGHHEGHPGGAGGGMGDRLYALGLHRGRLDERIDAAVRPVLALSRLLGRLERGIRWLSAGGRT